MKKLQPWCTASGYANDSATLENSTAVSYKVKHNFAMWPSSSNSVHLPRRTENTGLYKDIMFTAESVIKAPKWKQSKCPSTGNEQTKCDISIQSVQYIPFYPVSNKKEQITETCWIMDESQKWYTEWKKPDTKDYTLHAFIYMKWPEKQVKRNRK